MARPDIDRFIECAGERRIFDDRHLVLRRDLADAQCQPVLAFRDAHRGRHGVHVVTDGDGVVRRVDDDGGGFRHLAHHLPPQEIAAQPSNAPFHLRISFVALVLFLDFLLGHAQCGHMLPVLTEQIDGAEDDEESRCFPQQVFERTANLRGARCTDSNGSRMSSSA